MAQGSLTRPGPTIEQSERQLRELVEHALGRGLSDDEWEAYKRPPQRAHVESGHAWRWGGKERATCVASLVLALAGVGLLLGVGFVFSPFIRIPLGICMLLIALVPLLFGAWGWIIFSIWFAPTGWVMMVRDRDYLTSTHGWMDKTDTPAGVAGVMLVLVSILLLWVCRPTRSGGR